MKRQAPKTILISGASSGLGAELARLYASQPVTLLLTGRDALRLRAVALACTARGADVHYLCADIRDADTLHQWIVEHDRRQPIDLVIANAGVSGGPRDGFEPLTQVTKIISCNVQGVMNTIHPLISRMATRQSGQIAIISSLAGFLPLPGAPAYAASKAAVKTYGLALRLAMAKHKVAVNVICPGFVDTPMTRVNPYKMPWLMKVEDAAVKIRQGLLQDKAIIAFPWQLATLVRLGAVLPFWLQKKLLKDFPEKPELTT
jgi:short-subunit dehydrogenase